MLGLRTVWKLGFKKTNNSKKIKNRSGISTSFLCFIVIKKKKKKIRDKIENDILLLFHVSSG